MTESYNESPMALAKEREKEAWMAYIAKVAALPEFKPVPATARILTAAAA